MTEQGATRRHLAEIPGLAAKLPAFVLGVTPKDSTGPHSPAGSRPPVDLTLVDLINGSEIYNWVHLAYETMSEMCRAGAFGSSWAEKKAWLDQHPGPADWDDLSLCCQWLSRHSDWINEQFPDPEPIRQDGDHCDLHCTDGHYLTNKRLRRVNGRPVCGMCPQGFATSIARLHWAYRRAARELPDAKLNCLICGNRAFIDGEWFICREVEEHARTIKDIEHEYRYAPKATTAQIAERLHITQDVIHQWRSRGKNGRKLQPAEKVGRTLYWWPWDVFCFLHPTVAEAIEARDTASAG